MAKEKPNQDKLLDRAIQEGALDLEIFQKSADRIQTVSKSFEKECQGALNLVKQQGTYEQHVRSLLSVPAAYDLEPPDWLISGMLPSRSLCMLYGREGTGKSFVALSMLAAVASGRSFLGRDTKQGLCLYVTAEGVGNIGYRLEAWYTQNEDLDPKRDKIDLYVFGEPIPLHTERGLTHLQVLLAVLGYTRPALIVIDTLAACSPGMDENDITAVSALLENCSWLTQSGATVMLVHHSRKKGDTLRGHSALAGALHTVIKLDLKGKANLTMTCEKQKDGERFEKENMALQTVPLPSRTPDEHGELPTSCVLVPGAKFPTVNKVHLIVRTVQKAGKKGVNTAELQRSLEKHMSESTFYRTWRALNHKKHGIRFDKKTRKFVTSGP